PPARGHRPRCCRQSLTDPRVRDVPVVERDAQVVHRNSSAPGPVRSTPYSVGAVNGPDQWAEVDVVGFADELLGFGGGVVGGLLVGALVDDVAGGGGAGAGLNVGARPRAACGSSSGPVGIRPSSAAETGTGVTPAYPRELSTSAESVTGNFVPWSVTRYTVVP